MIALRKAGVFLALAVCSAPAHATERDCAGPDFDSVLTQRFGKIAGAAPVGFIANGAKNPACPGAEPVCRDKARAARGDLLALGPTFGVYVCAEKVKGQGAGVGWLPAASIDNVQRINDTGSFVGAWRRDTVEIRIVWQPDGHLTGEGLANPGAFAGDMDMRDGIAQFYGEGADPENPEALGCRIRMARAAEVMVVRDNGQCSGDFGGTYTRAPTVSDRK